MKLQAIRDALATQLKDLARNPTVFAYRPESRSGHNISIIPAGEYLAQETIGQSYEMFLQLDLHIDVPGRLPDSQIAMDDYLSTGAGTTSSVVDAVFRNPTLDGLVEDVQWLGVDGPDLDVDPLTAVVHFRFMVPRG